MKIIISGGRQSKSSLSYFNKEWSNGVSGVIFEYDTNSKKIEEKFNYETPERYRAEKDYSISFKSGSIFNNKLYVTTLTEILIISLPNYKLIDKISLNLFNDLHHVVYDSNFLYVVVTGLDLVLQYDLIKKRVSNYYNCFREVDTWDRFDKHKDYRKLNTTKPHFSHPNHVTVHNNKVYITRYKQEDVLIYEKNGRYLGNIKLDNGIPHDGSIFGSEFIYTTVTGKILKVDIEEEKINKIIDLNKFAEGDSSLGWCRGYTTAENLNYVGFSRIRPTKFIENIKWLGSKITDKYKLKMPTRVEIYDSEFLKIIDTIELEGVGLNWVFSILKY
tara:strand:- start:429 stop:1421 length:993 start_codon:yes stop_codon:yes gene_type:complete